MTVLRFKTSPDWVDTVLADFDHFLLDHAAAEKKASGMAMSMVSHYPDKPELIAAMTELAVEELSHFKEVVKIIYDKGLILGKDIPDAYINELRSHIRKGPENYLMDRLILGGIIEARGHERFGLVADALPEGSLKKFYQAITRSEERHYDVFTQLAYHYLPEAAVSARIDELLTIEADIMARQPIRPVLH